MSDSMLVLVEGSKLPTVEELRLEVKSLGLDLDAWDEQLINIEGFLVSSHSKAPALECILKV